MTYNVFSGTLNPTHFTSAQASKLQQLSLMTLHGLRNCEFVITMYNLLQCTWSSSFVTANFDGLKHWRNL